MSVGSNRARLYSCPDCVFTCSKLRVLQTHQVKTHGNFKIHCEHCDYTTAYHSNFYRHKKQVHGRMKKSQMTGQFVDNMSGNLNMSSNNDLSLNLPVANQSFGMDISDDQNSPAASLDCGMPLDLSSKSPNAKKENEQPSQTQIDQDLADYGGHRTYRCGECVYQTRVPREYLHHRRDVHSMRKRIHYCDRCQYASQQHAKLRRHKKLMHKIVNGVQETSNDANPKLTVSPAQLAFVDKLIDQSSTIVTVPVATPPNSIPPSVTGECVSESEQPPNQANQSISKVQHSLYVKCALCPYETRWPSVLRRHERVHEQNRPFKCKLCDRSSKWKADMIRHVANVHGKQALPVHDSLTTPSTKMSIECVTESEPTQYICVHCQFTDDDWQLVCDHLSNVHDCQPFHCAHCQFKHTNKPSVEHHMSECHSDTSNVSVVSNVISTPINRTPPQQPQPQQPQCEPVTPKPAPSPSTSDSPPNSDKSGVLQDVISSSVHSGAKHMAVGLLFARNLPDEIPRVPSVVQPNGRCLWQCRLCTHHSKRRSHIRTHEKLHFRPNPDGTIRCPQCPFKADKPALNQHFASEHQGPSCAVSLPLPILQCAMCPAVFDDPVQMTEHMSYHGSQLALTCAHCDYALSVHQSHALVQHNTVHD